MRSFCFGCVVLTSNRLYWATITFWYGCKKLCVPAAQWLVCTNVTPLKGEYAGSGATWAGRAIFLSWLTILVHPPVMNRLTML